MFQDGSGGQPTSLTDPRRLMRPDLRSRKLYQNDTENSPAPTQPAGDRRSSPRGAGADSLPRPGVQPLETGYKLSRVANDRGRNLPISLLVDYQPVVSSAHGRSARDEGTSRNPAVLADPQ